MARLTRLLRSAPSSPKTAYCPDAGDIIRINFDPLAGPEQAGARPALVLSPRIYNEKARLCVLCPITNQIKGYPFEVSMPDGHEVTGAVLSDQIKSLSWEQRGAVLICAAPENVVSQVKGKLRAILKI